MCVCVSVWFCIFVCVRGGCAAVGGFDKMLT